MKNKKNEAATVATTLNFDISNTKGQLTPQSDAVGYSRNTSSL